MVNTKTVKSGINLGALQSLIGFQEIATVKSLLTQFFLYYAYFSMGGGEANFMESTRWPKVKKEVVPFYLENGKIQVKECARRQGCGETYTGSWPAAEGLLMRT